MTFFSSHEKRTSLKRPPPDKEVMVLKPDFLFILHKKIPKYVSVTGFLLFA